MFSIELKTVILCSDMQKSINFEWFSSIYREWKEKFDLVDDEETDTLTYNYKNTFIYKKEKNGPGLTGDEIVTMPNPCTLQMEYILCPKRDVLYSFVLFSDLRHVISGECG